MSKYYLRVITADNSSREIISLQSDDPKLLIMAYDAIAFDGDTLVLDERAKANTETETNIPLSLWFDDSRLEDAYKVTTTPVKRSEVRDYLEYSLYEVTNGHRKFIYGDTDLFLVEEEMKSIKRARPTADLVIESEAIRA